MRIEYLYREVTCLYGEHANVTAIARAVPGCEVVETPLTEKPKFLDPEEKIDLVYMGTMTESAQLLVIEKLAPYRQELIDAIENGQNFLITGNALEIFGSGITEKGPVVFEAAGGEYVKGLAIFPFHTERDMIHRYNSLCLQEYKGIKVMGLHSQFGHSWYDGEVEPFFDMVRGPGFHLDCKTEGIHHKNFYATYTLGPLFIMNPPLMVKVLEEMGFPGVHPAFEETAMKAYEERVAEYSDPSTGFYYA